MTINTSNYNLKKPSPEDFYNVEDQNANMDILDAELKNLNENKAATEHSHNGVYETPAGAQSKADAAKTLSNQYTDQKFTTVNSGLSSHLSETAATGAKGHIQLATSAEVLTGTESSKAVTPAGLESKIIDYGNIIDKSASLTIALSERNKVVSMSGALAQTITIPANSSVSFQVGTQITFIQLGAGTVTFTPASGVILLSKDTKRTIDGQYAGVTLIKIAVDTWSIIGALK